MIKCMNQCWREPCISTRLAMQMAQLDFLALALGQHPMLLGREGHLGSQAAVLLARELHCSSGSGGVQGQAGESELKSMVLEAPFPQILPLL